MIQIQEYQTQVSPIPPYVPPCKKNKSPDPFNTCPVNTLFIKYNKIGENCTNNPLILNVFKFNKGFVEIKKLDNYAFVTFETTEDAKVAFNDFYNIFHESHPEVYITYADSPTFSTKNKNYKYKKYKSTKSTSSNKSESNKSESNKSES